MIFLETQYFKFYSPTLERDMECKVYGHAGRPVLFIPCQNGRFFDFENFHMTDVWRPWIDAGRVMVFSVDTLDQETWSNLSGDAGWRSWRHEQWMQYIFNEVVPFIRSTVNARNGWTGDPGVIAFGCSLGATHAVNLFFRRPDLFDGLLALSGIYTSSYGFGEYRDDKVYLNSPLESLAGVPADHPYIRLYNEHRGIIVVGQGDWELPETTYRLKDICESKGIQVWFDIWGHDSKHDWDWWYKQTAYHLPHLLD